MNKIDQHGAKNFLPKISDIDFFTVSDGTKIRTGYFPAAGQPTSTILLLNGHREFIEKYTEFIEDFQSRGFNVYTMDHRGQGLSQRALEDRNKSHNPDFDKLVTDIDQLVQEKIKPAHLGHPFYIVAHSMGALLALHYLHDTGELVEKAVLLSPLTELNTRSRFFIMLMKIFFAVMNAIGFGSKFAPGQARGQSMINHDEAFSKLTHDQMRYQWSQDALSANPDLFIGGVTYGGAAGTTRSLKKLAGKGYIGAIKTPILCLLSEQEHVVNNKSTQTLMKKMLNVRIETIPGARHEIYRETDEIRNIILQKIDRFLEP